MEGSPEVPFSELAELYLEDKKNHNGKPLSTGYMQVIVMELYGIFNYGVRYYKLPTNPCKVAGNLVGKKNKRSSTIQESGRESCRRIMTIPPFLCDIIRDFESRIYGMYEKNL